jgi:hypothetical protein
MPIQPAATAFQPPPHAPGDVCSPVRLCTAAAGLVCERAIPDCCFHIASAFNDMGLHTFPPDKLAADALEL